MQSGLKVSDSVVPGIRQLDARAVRASVDVVARVRAGDLARATPCSDWTLCELLAHMTVQHYGFAAASVGNGADPEVWRMRSFGDPVAAHAAAAERVLAAFGADGAGEREFALPEISAVTTFPGAQAMSFHFVDAVVHGWDVSRSLGLPFSLEPDLLDAAKVVAAAVPDGKRRLRPGAAFRPRVAPSDGASQLDVIVSMLGRSPGWPE
jgi:uncharacterized protein (TIGR03086 family)